MARRSGGAPDALMLTTDAAKYAGAKPGVGAPEMVVLAEHVLAGAYDNNPAERARATVCVRRRCTAGAELVLDALGLTVPSNSSETPS